MASANPEQETQCPGSPPQYRDQESVFHRKACVLLSGVHYYITPFGIAEWFIG